MRAALAAWATRLDVDLSRGDQPTCPRGVPEVTEAETAVVVALLGVRLGPVRKRWAARAARSPNELLRGDPPTRPPSARGVPAVAEAGTAVVVAGSEEGVGGGGVS